MRKSRFLAHQGGAPTRPAAFQDGGAHAREAMRNPARSAMARTGARSTDA